MTDPVGGGAPGHASAAAASEFEELVRDALHHMYDLSHLQTHPLARLIAGGEHGGIPAGRLVRQALLDAIEAVNPGPGAGATSRAWRSYRILELRFIEELDIGDVIRQVALSKSQYHREQNRAISAMASYLWERWRVERQWRDQAARPPPKAESGLGAAGASPSTIRSELRGFARADGAPALDLLAVLGQVVDLLAPLAAERGTRVRLRSDEALPIVRGDRVTLRQALLAVLAHAIVASCAGSVDVVVGRRGLEVELLVTGRSRGPVTGTRLGLDDCGPFVEALGGTVALASTAGQLDGWSVTLRLPAPRGPLLLAVDNDPAFVELIRRYLIEQEWDIVGASTADEALAVARTREPTAVLLDVVLPDRDGWELLLDLRRHPATREIPVVVCSALDERDMAMSLGAVAYLRKPITPADLITTLADATARRERSAT